MKFLVSLIGLALVLTSLILSDEQLITAFVGGVLTAMPLSFYLAERR